MAATKTVAHRQRARKFRVQETLAANSQFAITPRHGVVTLFGYGVQVRVDRGHLILKDGIGADRRYARFPRVGHGLKRLVIISMDGMVSLAALRWLSDQKAAFVMLDRNGSVLTTSGPSRTPDARIRRAQSLAIHSGTGLQIARDLIAHKLSEQEHIARNRLRNSEIAEAIAAFRVALSGAATFDAIRLIEAQAGATYWSAWRDLPIMFPRNDLPRVPEHWQIFQNRVSPLSLKSARLAASPANSMLNYSYAVLEAEACLAAAALGLDPTIGFLHSDMAHRDSLALDLMEPIRPLVDSFILDWITREPLKRDWFFEERNGNCRLMADLASRLSETADTWRRALAPVAESVAQSLWSSVRNSNAALATPLTQRRRREANDDLAQPVPTRPPKAPSSCRGCGVPVAPKRSYCVACSRVQAADTIQKQSARKTPEHEAKRRERSNSPEAQANRAAANRRDALACRTWDPSIQPAWLTQEFYVQRIQPALKRLPVSAITSAIGIAKTTATNVRLGRRVPHPRHWVKLAEIVKSVNTKFD